MKTLFLLLILLGTTVCGENSPVIDRVLSRDDLFKWGFNEDPKQMHIFCLREVAIGDALKKITFFKLADLRPIPKQSHDSDIRWAAFKNGNVNVFSILTGNEGHGSLDKLETKCDIVIVLDWEPQGA